MGQELYSGAMALALGAFVGVLLFVPFVAVSYRRRGRLTAGRALVWLAALVYFWAIWTYTLLPLPEPDTISCVPPNFDFGTIVEDLQKAAAAPGNPLVTPQFLQLALNIVLFMPLGFFVRVLGGRGFVIATLTGFAVSAVVETTQLTGVWGIYPCAYRMFDVVDLATNTAGALIGSLFALAVPRAWRRTGFLPEAENPHPVTRWRRLLAMLSDLLAFGLTEAAIRIGTQLVAVLALGKSASEAAAAAEVTAPLGTLAAIALWLIVTLATGRTIGDLTVRLRYSGGKLPWPLARVLRALGGVVGYALLGALPDPWSLLAPVFVITSLILVLTTEHGRGMPGVLSGQRLRDDREPLPDK